MRTPPQRAREKREGAAWRLKTRRCPALAPDSCSRPRPRRLPGSLRAEPEKEPAAGPGSSKGGDEDTASEDAEDQDVFRGQYALSAKRGTGSVATATVSEDEKSQEEQEEGEVSPSSPPLSPVKPPVEAPQPPSAAVPSVDKKLLDVLASGFSPYGS